MRLQVPISQFIIDLMPQGTQCLIKNVSPLKLHVGLRDRRGSEFIMKVAFCS